MIHDYRQLVPRSVGVSGTTSKRYNQDIRPRPVQLINTQSFLHHSNWMGNRPCARHDDRPAPMMIPLAALDVFCRVVDAVIHSTNVVIFRPPKQDAMDAPSRSINWWVSDGEGVEPCTPLYPPCRDVRRSCGHLPATSFRPHPRPRKDAEEVHSTVSTRSEGLSDHWKCAGSPQEHSDMEKLPVDVQ